MEIVVRGRHAEVTDRFREHALEKISKVRLDPRAMRVDVEVAEEANPRRGDERFRIEITVRSKGPVVRAEAAADDKYAALDLATQRLTARLQKRADRRRVHHGHRTPVSVAQATAGLDAPDAAPDGLATEAPPVDAEWDGLVAVQGDGPLVVREKTHEATPMTLDQALYEMELVGHDFFLFVDEGSRLPSVVYRRRGFDYGVIRLST